MSQFSHRLKGEIDIIQKTAQIASTTFDLRRYAMGARCGSARITTVCPLVLRMVAGRADGLTRAITVRKGDRPHRAARASRVRNGWCDYGAERGWDQVRCPSTHLRLGRRGGRRGRGRGSENIDRSNSLIRLFPRPQTK